jgi:CheY-like chemotaxis protein
MTILVIEDNDLVRLLLVDMLEEQGCTTIGVADGRAALHYLQSTVERPKLIILDLMMPTMDGWALCATLRRNATLAAIPIVITSARHDIADQAAQLGVAGYLAKPFERDMIEALVQRYGPAMP